MASSSITAKRVPAPVAPRTRAIDGEPAPAFPQEPALRRLRDGRRRGRGLTDRPGGGAGDGGAAKVERGARARGSAARRRPRSGRRARRLRAARRSPRATPDRRARGASRRGARGRGAPPRSRPETPRPRGAPGRRRAAWRRRDPARAPGRRGGVDRRVVEVPGGTRGVPLYPPAGPRLMSRKHGLRPGRERVGAVWRSPGVSVSRSRELGRSSASRSRAHAARRWAPRAAARRRAARNRRAEARACARAMPDRCTSRWTEMGTVGASRGSSGRPCAASRRPRPHRAADRPPSRGHRLELEPHARSASSSRASARGAARVPAGDAGQGERRGSPTRCLPPETSR